MKEKKLDCTKICELLTAYLDGEVTPQEKADIERHLDGCPKCRAELESLSAVQNNLRSVLKSTAEEAAPPPQVWEHIKDRLPKEKVKYGVRSGSIWGRVTATAGTIAVILFVAFVGWKVIGSLGMGSAKTATTMPPMYTTTTAAPTTTMPAATTTPQPTFTATVPPATSPIVPPMTTAPPVKNIKMEAAFAKETYLPGEVVYAEISYTNVTSTSFNMSPFPPDMEVIAGFDDVIYHIPAGTEALNIPPGSTVTRLVTWDQHDENGVQVPYGQYQFRILPGGTLEDSALLGKIFILPPEGVIEKTFAVNQSVTVGGKTLTLERIELTAAGPRFYVFNSDFGTIFNNYPYPVYARYSLDSGAVREKYRELSRSGHSDIDGAEYVWVMFIPVPHGAHMLTFTVDKFGDYQGPWEFTVPLD